MTDNHSNDKEDIIVLRKWLEAEPHLHDDFDELMLRKFLHSCYWDMEKTKKCIERFCVSRNNMDEVYIGRDPLSKRVQVAFSIVNIVAYTTPTKQEILIYEINDPGLDKFVFYDVVTAFTLIGDCWLNDNDFLAEEHLVIMDMQAITLKIVPKVNLLFLKTFFLYLMEATPVRLKELHLINCPNVIDKIFAIVKPILPSGITNLIKFHTTLESLHKVIDRKSLPIEYGGEAGSMVEQSKDWVRRAEAKREYFLNDNLWKADKKKKSKNSNSVNTVSGSFKSLDID